MSSWTTHEAANAAGVSFRQADYWDKAGVCRPTHQEAQGSGTRRRYSDLDVLHLALAGKLMRHLDGPAVGRVLAWLGDRPFIGWLVIGRPTTVATLPVELFEVVHRQEADVALVVNLDGVRIDVEDRLHVTDGPVLEGAV